MQSKMFLAQFLTIEGCLGSERLKLRLVWPFVVLVLTKTLGGGGEIKMRGKDALGF